MTTRPSIESLRETLYEIIPPSDPESEHPGRFSDLLAALDELERLRQMPTLEAAAIARADALAARCEALRTAVIWMSGSKGFGPGGVAVAVFQANILPLLESTPAADLEAHDAWDQSDSILSDLRAAGLLDEGREG